MSYRYMRMIVFFDLPSVSTEEKREYLKFRKLLLADGFVMMQESVYTKIALNQTAIDAARLRIENHKPTSGLVQLMVITEKQYAAIEYICGKKQTEIIESDERLIIF